MSINYFRNLKRQQPIDNRPKYLRYGDVFISSKDNPNRQQPYQRYGNTITNQDIPMQNNKYKVFNTANIDRVRDTNRMNSNTGNIYPKSMGINDQNNQYNNIYNNNMRSNQEDYNDNVDYLQRNNNQFNQQGYNDNYYNDESYYKDNYLFSNKSRQSNYIPEWQDDALENSNRYNISNNSKVNYKKRQLPPLQQRYSSHNAQYDLQYDNQYWEDYDAYKTNKINTKQDLKLIWQKFIIAFTSILSIVCIAWIAYHWSSNAQDNNKTSNTPEIIEPDKPSFKVLPDVPGGIEIPYKDKSIYNRVDPNFKYKTREKLQASPEVPEGIPKVAKINNPQVAEYSIIEDKEYYVKCPINTNANEQVKAIKKKLLDFPDSDMLEGAVCSIRTVANTEGRKGKFILIGPFFDDNTAKQIGHFCKIKGEIISVKKTNRN